jgi:hypothetical protein
LCLLTLRLAPKEWETLIPTCSSSPKSFPTRRLIATSTRQS